MQATEADIYQQNRCEEAINFRPSPNFKHMRKYLKSKFEESGCNGSSAGEQNSSSSAEEEERGDSTGAMLQPPLPPNPPPPPSPLRVALKREIEDDEYQGVERDAAEGGERQRTMCRQFVRGTCTRGPSCIYVHELLLDQLPGVYTFCKNFQNNGCSLPRCKFVHATVFEKEYFYRSGFLPPHATAHLKENANAPPPQPQPAPQPSKVAEASGAVHVPTAFPNPPPPIVYPGMAAPGPSAGLAAASRKRDWTCLMQSGASACASAAGALSPRHELFEATPKKCRDCDITELRYQCNKSKVEKLLRSTQESKSKLASLSRKHSQLYSIITALVKANPDKAGPAALFNPINIRNEKEKAILNNLDMYLSANRHPLAADIKNMNLEAMLMRLLFRGEGSPPS